MIEAILFDADGVLINGPQFSAQVEKDYGWSRELTADFFRGPFQDCLVGNADLREVLPPYLKRWGWQGSVDEFIDYWFKSGHQLDQPLIEYAQKLRARDIKCYVATNQEAHRVQYMLEHMGFRHRFDGVIASAHVGHTKPKAGYFEAAMAKLRGIDKAEVLLWDDDQKNIDGGHAFGMQAEFYTNFAQFQAVMTKKYHLP